MPTYEYLCQDCDRTLEVFQSFTDDALTVCPECAGSLRKVFNSVGVVFKGSGFYRTDSRDSSSASTTAAPKKAEPSAAPATPSTPASTPTTPSA